MSIKISSKMIKYMFHGWAPTKASLQTLREKHDEFINELQNIRYKYFQGKDAPTREEIDRLHDVWFKKEIQMRGVLGGWEDKLREAEKRSISLFDSFFDSESARRQRIQKNNDISLYKRKIQEAREELDNYIRLGNTRVPELIRQSNEFYRVKRAIEIIDELIEKKEKEQEKKQQIQNELAKTRQKKRALAKVIKPGVPKNKCCPYCGVILDYTVPDMVHLDHIYPLSKGGQSTRKNLVYVCSECNRRKGKLTLHYFIKKYGLDKEKIEETLESLNKDF